ncbi:succinate dehydrogenase / fumarate reductase cytochrome b subunit [Amycolatopsis pretoriensis]|uniref:Succinate dehydrogenase / fumarate reductase cytochrome b subunit n=1 Tax=Amycolatopsis pretoriensis TaxID=218821 RepID=A0A1H5QE96_9PSEU|nr:succinate dehydrogenase cytochrome b subunit [Amycolatopsis pretoriensis]SEF23711.1 succinate dehydrogenase / fumarate reductase cytochrome b subunit [Amycolatopsis pretoriensis]
MVNDLATRRPVRQFWASTIGKKIVMAVTGALLLAFVFAHMIGNLKTFLGADDLNHYAHWLRTIGEPVLPYAWFLWIQRVVLLVALVLHVTAAVQLVRRDRKARPVPYVHRRPVRATFAVRTMRWGGATLALFVVWHILDFTVGTVNRDFVPGDPYHNLVADFRVWWVNLIYLAALAMLGLHIQHGFASAARTLGVTSARRERAIKLLGNATAVVIAGGYALVPVAIMTGLVD